MLPNPARDENLWFHVDDDEDDLLVYRDLISEALPQVHLEQFTSSFELIRKLNTATTIPRLILIDFNMPIMDGLACLKHVRILPHINTYTRLVILSTNSHKDQIDLCHAAGAHFYAIKPQSPQEIKKLGEKLVDICHKEFRWPVSKKQFLLTPEAGA